MNAVIVIPARAASTRLPGKMLLEAGGKPLIQHAFERAKLARSCARVLVATDDLRIRSAVEGFGGEAVMTDPAHSSGSARVAEAARSFGPDIDVVVNVQGDEPELDPSAIDRLVETHRTFRPFASTLVCPFPDTARPEDPNAVKAVLGMRRASDVFDALYFTRAPAPFPRDVGSSGDYHLHVGVYAFSPQTLQRFAAAPEGRLERIERLEQLRILEMGDRITAARIASAAPGIDTAADLEAFCARLAARRPRS